MVDNQQIKKINKLLQKQIVQKFSVLAVALLVVGSVAYFGTQQNQGSHAASLGLLTMSPTTATLIQGSNVSVTLSENSGTDTVNAVQASVSYDATKLQYVSMSEGTAFPTVAANSTATAGLIRVGRATLPASPVTGTNTIVVLTFKVIGGSGTAALTYDSAFSFLVRSTDNVNTLTSATGATYTLKLPAPTISSVAPASGSTAGGTALTISGANFVAGSTVTIGGVPATNVVVGGSTTPTAMTITATSPAHAYGAAIVVVTNPDGQTVSKSAGFTYVAPAPTITGTAPNTGVATGGTAVTISGTNFMNGATVKIGGVAATNVAFVSATSITAVTPAHAAGGADVVVTNPDGQIVTAVVGFTYQLPTPVITTVSPATGPASGGTTLTITGTNFVGITAVSIGGVAATSMNVVSATSITAVTPVHASGLVAVTVSNASGTATKTGAFTYSAPAPSVSAVSPALGTASGGTIVTITGSNFVSGAKVTFGTTAATNVTFVSSTTLTATAPANATGLVAITVINPDAQKGSLSSAYTYLTPGDANGDGRVNAIDLSILISHDGQNYPQADFNGDGTVGSADLAILLGKWTW
jgi:hypothetical protein